MELGPLKIRGCKAVEPPLPLSSAVRRAVLTLQGHFVKIFNAGRLVSTIAACKRLTELIGDSLCTS